MTVSVIVKPKSATQRSTSDAAGAPGAAGPSRVTRAEFKKHHAADADAFKIVRAFAREFNLKVEADPACLRPVRRTLQLTGTAADMQKAFGVELRQTAIDGAECRVREGGIRIPSSLAEVVEAVLGLDNRPQAKPHFRLLEACRAILRLHLPPSSGEGLSMAGVICELALDKLIGIIELGGGYRLADITAYFKTLESCCTCDNCQFWLDGGKESSQPRPSSADGESDAGYRGGRFSCSGKTKVAVYFAPNTDQGLSMPLQPRCTTQRISRA